MRTRSSRSFFESRVSRSGSSTFWKAVSTGSRLNDWNTKPTFRERHSASCAAVIALTSAPPTRTVPLVGLSSPAMRLSRVDLPEPDGPMRAVKRALLDVHREAGEDVDPLGVAVEGLVDVSDFDQGHERLARR